MFRQAVIQRFVREVNGTGNATALNETVTEAPVTDAVTEAAVDATTAAADAATTAAATDATVTEALNTTVAAAVTEATAAATTAGFSPIHASIALMIAMIIAVLFMRL